jgi:hypothetical protein
MARVLFVGQQPETVDFTNPVLPPGMNAERIHGGITLALKQMAERGWHADLCLLRPDETAGLDVERRLKAQTYDCVVIGAGIRLPPHSLSMFEAAINAVHRAAPNAAIAFNTRPEDSADAGASFDGQGHRRSSSGSFATWRRCAPGLVAGEDCYFEDEPGRRAA